MFLHDDVVQLHFQILIHGSETKKKLDNEENGQYDNEKLTRCSNLLINRFPSFNALPSASFKRV